jgi:ADP-ribose pyrophosphatase YjhB (NUDIX family)
MRYSMTFALSPDLDDVVFLRKPSDHKNPLFRDKWTVPGGLIESNESDVDGAVRELMEEAYVSVNACDMVSVLTFSCNCDPTEPEHEVVVFGVQVPIEKLLSAKGDRSEPVVTLKQLPKDLLWYVEPLLALVKGRMRQPRRKWDSSI